MTSLLFAAAHLFPPQAVALLPLAVLIHVSYLATRSILAPMLIHFLNNAWATVLVKYGAEWDLGPLAADALPPHLVAACAFCAFTVGALLWKTRVEYRLPDGTTWSPGYPTVEPPPQDVEATPICGAADKHLVGLAVISVLLLVAGFVI